MYWTLALVLTGLGGLWLIGKHWWGWLLYTLNEVLWFAYALDTHDTPLAIMAVVWFTLGVRNCVLHQRKEALA